MSLGVTVDGSNGLLIDHSNGQLTLNSPTTSGGASTLTTTTGDLDITTTAGNINISAGVGYAVNINNFSYAGPLILDGSAGTAGQVATSQGPLLDAQWTTPLLSTLGDVTLTGVANGDLLQYNGTDWVNVLPTSITPTKATNLAGGAAGQMPWQSAADTTGFTAAGTTGQVLLSGGTGVPTWATSAPQATNLSGGVAGSMPWQSAVGTTGFTAAGSIGQVLISNGASAPTWANNAPEASNLSGGVAGSVVYQTAAGITGYTAVGTTGQMLVSNGAAAPAWGTTLTQVAAGAVITAGGSSSSPLVINSTNTRGGAGFAEIAQFINGGGGTNINKFLRMNSTGTLELLNSAYTAALLTVADSGIITTAGVVNQPNNQTNVNPNTGNNNGIKGPGGYVAYMDNLGNAVLGDYTQTNHDTWIETGRAIILAPNGANSSSPNNAISAQINTAGQFLVGTASTNPLVGYGAPKFAVTNNAGQDGGAVISPNGNNALNVGKFAPNTNGSGVTGAFISFVGAGSASTATYGNITANGAGVSYNTSSDARLKENVVTLTGCLDKVKALRPVSYDWIDNNTSDIGFIAQEAESIVPEAITAPVEGNPSFQYYQMDLTRLVPVLTAAIQEQQAVIEALQARLDKAGL